MTPQSAGAAGAAVLDLSGIANLGEPNDELLPTGPSDLSTGWFAVVASRISAATTTGDASRLREVRTFLRRAASTMTTADPAEQVAPMLALRAVAEVVTHLIDDLTLASPAGAGDSEWARMLQYIGEHQGATNNEVAAGTRMDFTSPR